MPIGPLAPPALAKAKAAPSASVALQLEAVGWEIVFSPMITPTGLFSTQSKLTVVSPTWQLHLAPTSQHVHELGTPKVLVSTVGDTVKTGTDFYLNAQFWGGTIGRLIGKFELFRGPRRRQGSRNTSLRLTEMLAAAELFPARRLLTTTTAPPGVADPA